MSKSRLRSWLQFMLILFPLVLAHAGCGDGLPTGPAGDGGDDDPTLPVWDPADFACVYEVGPGQAYDEPGDVPWEALAPSSLVRIHWREAPYRAKWVINTAGAADAPVVVLGVPSEGRRPVITGDGAATRLELNYWNEVRSVVKIGGSNLPHDAVVPAYVTLQGLEIRSGRPAYGFIDDAGEHQSYAENAAAVHIEIGEHISIRDCRLHDCGNGLFAGSQASDVVISGNRIDGNGIHGSIYHHNSYTECLGILFEYNWYGPLREGCLGNNLKDRSAGTVIRCNFIESGNRQLDLVETDYDELRDHPSYDETFVYGNILVEPDDAGNSQIIHYGGDGSDTSYYRRGTLYLYHNTVVSTRAGNTTLLRCATNDVTVDARNNILHGTAGGDRFAISSGRGQIALVGNWLPDNWRETHENSFEGTITATGNVTGPAPGLLDLPGGDYRPCEDSACLDITPTRHEGALGHPVNREYAHPCGFAVRTATAVGALEP